MTAPQQGKKLIEVALPLDEINAACKAYKDRKVGTIRNIHKWFAPMPLPAWRTLLFAALIDDPGDEDRRLYLLDVMKRLVANGADLPDAATLAEAQALLTRQFPDGVPAVMDPFCGGGSTLVEAQRLGLPTLASDLNPVPVLITRTLTSLLPAVRNGQAVQRSPYMRRRDRTAAAEPAWTLTSADPVASAVADVGYAGLVKDLNYYAEKLLDDAWDQVGELYPHQAGETPIAWLWGRTATCPNPTCGVETVLTTSWWVSKKPGEQSWIEPSVTDGAVRLQVVSGRRGGTPPASPKSGRGATFACVACQQILDEPTLIQIAAAGGLGVRIVAVIADTAGGRVYREPTSAEQEVAAECAVPDDFGQISLGPVQRYVSPPRFGLFTQADLYTPRQLRVLVTLADLIAKTKDEVIADGGSEVWGTTVATILALTLGKTAQANSGQVRWNTAVAGSPKAEPAFGRNDIPMLWDFAETYPFGRSVGSFIGILRDQVRAFKYVSPGQGVAVRADARTVTSERPALVATDPPYFDAIGYADLSDYFYVWHRRALRHVHPDLYGTTAAPKTGELTAMPSHHNNSRTEAKTYFVEGFTETFHNLKQSMGTELPLIVVYASKEQQGGADEETRWSSILSAIVQADLQITGTWPIHGTTAGRMIGNETNAVATYVAMVCRPRPPEAGTTSLGDFNRALRRELKPAVHDLQSAGILPVDLAQAAMGPGMQVYSRYRGVLDQSGKRVPVDTALRLINAALGEVLDEQEGELDPQSRFAVAWWERHGWTPAAFGEADQLARPQGLSVDDLVRSGVVEYSRPGYVAALGVSSLSRTWTPSQDKHPTAWEAVHHLADRLIDGGGVEEAGKLLAELGNFRDPAQALVYRLHDIAAKKSRTKDQERYNSLIGSWSDLLAVSVTQQDGLF